MTFSTFVRVSIPSSTSVCIFGIFGIFFIFRIFFIFCAYIFSAFLLILQQLVSPQFHVRFDNILSKLGWRELNAKVRVVSEGKIH